MTNLKDYLLSIKTHNYCVLKDAIEMADNAIAFMKSVKDEYMASHNTPTIDSSVDDILNRSLINLMKYAFLDEIHHG